VPEGARHTHFISTYAVTLYTVLNLSFCPSVRLSVLSIQSCFLYISCLVTVEFTVFSNHTLHNCVPAYYPLLLYLELITFHVFIVSVFVVGNLEMHCSCKCNRVIYCCSQCAQFVCHLCRGSACCRVPTNFTVDASIAGWFSIARVPSVNKMSSVRRTLSMHNGNSLPVEIVLPVVQAE